MYGVIEMAFSFTRSFIGSCGNFKFRVFTLTNVQDSISIMDAGMNVLFCNSTNTSDNADVFNAKPLAWESTCDNNTANEIVDSAVTFVEGTLDDCQAWNQTDDPALSGVVSYKDADELYVWKSLNSGTAYDICPDGNEKYLIQSAKKIMLDTATSDDDGTLIVFGR